jgi:hypothetical protein
MTITPRSLDEARRLLPGVGVTIYAQTPGGPVTLELLEAGDSPDEPPQAIVWEAPTEREAWEKAFPPTAAEPLSFDESFLPREGTAAHAELAVSQDDAPGGLFD